MMSLALLVTGSPSQSQAHLSAIRFTKAALSGGVPVKSVFFYQDAVHVANRFNYKPSDETNITSTWLKLAETGQFELQVCVAAANRRGILSREDSVLTGKFSHSEEFSLETGFALLGLGQLVAAMSDPALKIIHFR